MKITFWGARGSIPAPGKDKAKYGGHTTCVEIRLDDGSIIIIDAGTGLKELSNVVSKDKSIETFNFLMTHTHWDHIFAFPFFMPCYFKHYNINVYGCPFANRTIKNMIAKIWDPPYFPIPFTGLNANFNLNTEKCFIEMEIGSLIIKTIVLNHPNLGIGYKFIEGDKSFVFLTDHELSHIHYQKFNRKDYLKFAEGTDLLVHDAQYDNEEYKYTKSWGHSTFEDAVLFGVESGAKQLGLFHHDYDHTDEQMDKYVNECNELIYSKNSKLKCFGVEDKMTFEL